MAKASRCDYAFHGCINAPGPDIPDVIRRYVEAGVRTVKLFTTYRGLLMVEIDTVEQVMRALEGRVRADLRARRVQPARRGRAGRGG